MRLFCDLTNGQFAAGFHDRSQPALAFPQNNDIPLQLYLLESVGRNYWPFAYHELSGKVGVTAILSLRNAAGAVLATTTPLESISVGWQGVLHTGTVEIQEFLNNLIGGGNAAPVDLSVDLVNGEGQKLNVFKRAVTLQANGEVTPVVLSEEDSVQIAIDQVQIPIAFRIVDPHSPHVFTKLYIENLVDAPPLLDLEPTAGAVTADGRLIHLNGLPETANYVLHWKVEAINDPLHGYLRLAAGEARVAVYFDRVVAALDLEFEYHYVENAIDPPPIISILATPGGAIMSGPDIIGCWFDLNGAPDTENYILRWALRA